MMASLPVHFTGILIGVISFLSIGVFHPIVIKAEYHFSKACWPVFLVAGILLMAISVMVDHTILSSALAVIGMSRVVFAAAGWVCAILGTIGACVPLLPTVPLYLLAALCFAKGSKRLHSWFVSTRLYQENLKSYAEGKGMTRKTKARIMLTISAQMAIGYAFMGHAPIGRAALVCVWCGLMAYFAFVVKTRSK